MTILEKEKVKQAWKLAARLNITKQQKGLKGETTFITKQADIAFRDTITKVSNAFNSSKP